MSAESYALCADERRFVRLEGGHNFRDLGGYPTADGRQVRWGSLFRSGALDGLTAADYRQLVTLGVRAVCDLRSTRERRASPVTLPAEVGIEYWARDYEGSAGNLIWQMRQAGTTTEEMQARMTAAYRRVPYEQSAAYAELFGRAVRGGLPLVFACAAGKDRTGIAAALLLDALGVQREITIADYLITEQFSERLRGRLLARLGHRLSGVAADVWAPVIRAQRCYIETMFAEIDARDGSVEAYLAAHLQLNAPMLAQLRNNLLEKPSS